MPSYPEEVNALKRELDVPPSQSFPTPTAVDHMSKLMVLEVVRYGDFISLPIQVMRLIKA